MLKSNLSCHHYPTSRDRAYGHRLLMVVTLVLFGVTAFGLDLSQMSTLIKLTGLVTLAAIALTLITSLCLYFNLPRHDQGEVMIDLSGMVGNVRQVREVPLAVYRFTWATLMMEIGCLIFLFALVME